MPKVFLDLTAYHADRNTLRRLEKDLKKNQEFDSKKGKVFFFQFKRQEDCMVFFAAMLRAMTMTGWKGILTTETEENLIRNSK